jgi:hypothetical protein
MQRNMKDMLNFINKPLKNEVIRLGMGNEIFLSTEVVLF